MDIRGDALIIAWFLSGIYFVSRYPLAEKFGMIGTFIFLVTWLACGPLGIHHLFKGSPTRNRL